jgi:surfeit locus 1 family protein
MKRPPLIPTALFLFFAILMTSLGFWQLDRAKQKEKMLELMSEDSVQLVKKAEQLETLDKYAKVEMNGAFNRDHQFLLDNQVHEGEVGYHLFTPFYIKELKTYVLVNRGWVAKGMTAKKMDELDLSEKTISGRLTYPPKVGYQMGEIELVDSSHQVITYYEEDKIQKFLEDKFCKTQLCYISERVLWLNESETDGFVRIWKPVIMPPEKHIGYAVQWFSMTLVLILLFVFFLRKANSENDTDTKM